MNMTRKKYCAGECDFKSHFLSQAGNGYGNINVFRGVPYQRGRGLGSIIARFGIPLAKFLGKHLLKTGLAIGSDIFALKKSPKEVFKKRSAEAVTNIAKEGINKASDYFNQKGSGRKRKKISKSKRKRVKRDIFD